MRYIRWLLYVILFFWVLLSGPVMVLLFGNITTDNTWQDKQNSRANLAPPTTIPQAVIQIYAARSFGWQGAFTVDTWIVSKRLQATHYTLYQVVGWYQQMNASVLTMQRLSEKQAPDNYWYGQPPFLLADLRGGEEVDALIDRLENAAVAYPYKNTYRTWLGPNSNTFTAYIARQLPELRVDMPTTAMGKDFLPNGDIFAVAPSGSGGQISLYGIIGLTLAVNEGIEFNFIGLHFGLDLFDMAIRFPGVGRIGFE
ncbi:DUF3750 domain-containing protein [Beggiatoa leptomitoformis]|uniref:DUF3750 domain-containing protein n=1 Tax=Beggiatoa leptomitoformis TaxID=288004 RepID=A0A2N9YE53_9GAMM|nr:DUF3750 domain-containing protein [Beggiatoa leptomitoformis]ALG68868.1 DUF3750 domain-containing protein [Beggiatoa leptomitoformis]AUI68762.1 DUF3750 domain-containing protein [Beggiatoa leptomitoformis]